MANVTPLGKIAVEKHLIPAYRSTYPTPIYLPNCSITNRPVFIYRGVFPPSTNASAIESHLTQVGVVAPQWRYTMYKATHFHSNTHEVLCIASGRAKLCLGGEENPGRIEPEVKKGDVLILPAGVAHRLLSEVDGFEMVGSYPPDTKDWDMCFGDGDRESIDGRIKRVRWFEGDPVYGESGPVLDPYLSIV
ncbi:hypothetical protein QBC46DRAFT_398492 [Diplogelasinospora grovesii]|uniref:Cupin type-2 domain-containing protein n=1 Tax=Diplogelasinospora grovesii TaxID=303347 RepID=A0AAN6MYS6_9PEZI|nr:hypothetical protein QBC46DRAFT_398492 [Diplogelasinospora grovesii]